MDNKNENTNVNNEVNKEVETPQVVTPPTDNNIDNQSTTSSSVKPQVVEVNNTEEVKQQVASSNNQNGTDNVVPTAASIDENSTGRPKKGRTVFLVLLMILLFAFVFFLPEISNFITNYKNEVTGANDLKSGNMTCTMSNTTENLDYTYKLEFNYTENKLKKSTATTTARLSDNATESGILEERQNSCLMLKEVLDDNDIGISASCTVTAAMQETIQNIDYIPIINYYDQNLENFKLIPYDQYTSQYETTHYHYQNGLTKKWIEETYQQLIPQSLSDHVLQKTA